MNYKVGECYQVNLKGKAKYNSMVPENFIAIIKLVSTVKNRPHSPIKRHNTRFNIEVVKMVKGGRWPYTTISVNNLRTCGAVKLKGAEVLYV